MRSKALFISTLLLCQNAMAEDGPNTEEVSPPKLGHFSLPSTQGPGPLVGIGQHILDQGGMTDNQCTLSQQNPS